MKKQCIVIFYSGSPMDITGANNILTAIVPYLHEGSSEPSIKVLNEDELAQEIARTAMPPHVTTEDGDAAVAALMYRVPSDCIDNQLKLAVALTKLIATAEVRNNTEDRALIHALSILAQDKPVSKGVATKWHFTKAIRNTIKQVYSNYINS